MTVEEANRSGRLHPSQRGKVLDGNFWTAAVLAVAGLVGAVLLAGSGSGPGVATAVPILALVAWFAFVCLRRFAEVRDGTLVAITGWTHDCGREQVTHQYPIELRETRNRGAVWHYLHADGQAYRVDDRELWARIHPDRTNTVLLTPRTKLLINVLPA